MSRVFGLTGGIASGKSTVSGILREEGVPIVDADELARVIVEPGTEGLRLIVRSFGEGVLQADGTLDRPKLGSTVFSHPDKLQQLDDIMSPLLLEACGQKMRALQDAGHPLICFDAALLVERKLHERFRPLVVVAASEKTQIARMMPRDGFNEAEARARLRAQLPLEEKVKLADYVINNDGTYPDLKLQVVAVLAHLREKFK